MITEENYIEKLNRIKQLRDSKKGSDEFKELTTLIEEVDKFENKYIILV